MPEERLVCLTIDVCEDIHRGPEGRWGFLDRLVETRERFATHLLARGSSCKITWFPRADKSIEREFGTVTGILDRPELADFSEAGDEIGWHAHFYDGAGDQITDGRAMAAEAAEVIPAVRALFPAVESSRFGRLHMTNELAATLEAEGFRQDANCLSGRKETRKAITFDWSTSPDGPYRMSERDYRTPGEPARRLLELPYAMKTMKTSIDRQPVRRYVNLAFKEDLIRDGLEELDDRQPCILIVHPFEILPHDRGHHLTAFDMEAALRNLDAILDHFESGGARTRLVTVGEAAEAWRRSHE
jgi:hypothetical protein